MLYQVVGDLLQAPQKVIAHGCNCQGVMGSGVALAVRRLYPAAYEAYRDLYVRGHLRPGTVQLVRISDSRWVANCITQSSFGWAGRYARPEWIRQSLGDLKRQLLDEGELAMSPIGCSRGGLDWKEVRPLVEELARDFDIWVYRL